MDRLVAIFQYNDALHKRANNPFPSTDGWDGTKGPWCMFTAIQVRPDEFVSGRVVRSQPVRDTYTVSSITEYNGNHRTPFKLELIYEES